MNDKELLKVFSGLSESIREENQIHPTDKLTDLTNKREEKLNSLGNKLQYENLQSGTYTQLDTTGTIESNKNKVWNDLSAGGIQMAIGEAASEQIYKRDDGSKYQLDAMGNKRDYTGETERLYIYGTKDGSDAVKLGLARGDLPSSDYRYEPGRAEKEGYSVGKTGYGWDAGETGVDLNKKLLDIELPKSTATVLEGMVHGRTDALANRQYPDYLSDAALKHASGVSEYYNSMEGMLGDSTYEQLPTESTLKSTIEANKDKLANSYTPSRDARMAATFLDDAMPSYNQARGFISSTLNLGAKIIGTVGEGLQTLGEQEKAFLGREQKRLDKNYSGEKVSKLSEDIANYLEKTGNGITKEMREFQLNNDANKLTGYSTRDVDELSAEIDATIKKDGYLTAIGKALTDGRSLEVLTNSVPEMIALAASVGGMAIVNAQNNIDLGQAEIGREFTTKEKAASAVTSIVGTYLDRLGDKLALGGMNGAKGLLKEAVDNAPEKVKDMLASKFGAGLLKIGEAPLKLTGAGAVEGSTEYLQTLSETAAKNPNVFTEGFTDEQLSEADVAGTLGFAMGTHMSGGMRAIRDIPIAAQYIGEQVDTITGREVDENTLKSPISRDGRANMSESLSVEGFTPTEEAKPVFARNEAAHAYDLFRDMVDGDMSFVQSRGYGLSKPLEPFTNATENVAKLYGIEDEFGKKVIFKQVLKDALSYMKGGSTEEGVKQRVSDEDIESFIKQVATENKDNSEVQQVIKDYYGDKFKAEVAQLMEDNGWSLKEDQQLSDLPLTQANVDRLKAALSGMKSLGSESADISKFTSEVEKYLDRSLGSEDVSSKDKVKSMSDVSTEVEVSGWVTPFGNYKKGLTSHLNDLKDIPTLRQQGSEGIKQADSIVNEFTNFAMSRTSKVSLGKVGKAEKGGVASVTPFKIGGIVNFTNKQLNENNLIINTAKSALSTPNLNEQDKSRLEDIVTNVSNVNTKLQSVLDNFREGKDATALESIWEDLASSSIDGKNAPILKQPEIQKQYLEAYSKEFRKQHKRVPTVSEAKSEKGEHIASLSDSDIANVLGKEHPTSVDEVTTKEPTDSMDLLKQDIDNLDPELREIAIAEFDRGYINKSDVGTIRSNIEAIIDSRVDNKGEEPVEDTILDNVEDEINTQLEKPETVAVNNVKTYIQKLEEEIAKHEADIKQKLKENKELRADVIEQVRTLKPIKEKLKKDSAALKGLENLKKRSEEKSISDKDRGLVLERFRLTIANTMKGIIQGIRTFKALKTRWANKINKIYKEVIEPKRSIIKSNKESIAESKKAIKILKELKKEEYEASLGIDSIDRLVKIDESGIKGSVANILMEAQVEGKGDISKLKQLLLDVLPAIKKKDMKALSKDVANLLRVYGDISNSLTSKDVKNLTQRNDSRFGGIDNILKKMIKGQTIESYLNSTDPAVRKRLEYTMITAGLVTYKEMRGLGLKNNLELEEMINGAFSSILGNYESFNNQQIEQLKSLVITGQAVPQAMFNMSAGRRVLSDLGIKLTNMSMQEVSDITQSLGAIANNYLIRANDQARASKGYYAQYLSIDGNNISINSKEDSRGVMNKVKVFTISDMDTQTTKQWSTAAGLVEYIANKEQNSVQLEPTKRADGTKARRSNTKLTKKETEYQNKLNSREYEFKQSGVELIESFREDGSINIDKFAEFILGGTLASVVKKEKSIYKKPAVYASYKADRLDIENMIETYEMVGTDKFYLNHDMTVVGRHMVVSSMLNPQNSKISRFIVGQNDMAWNLNSLLKNKDINNTELVRMIELAAGQAMHIDVDKKHDDDAVKDLHSKQFKIEVKGNKLSVKYANKQLEEAVTNKDLSLYEAITQSGVKSDKNEIMHLMQAIHLLRGIENSEGNLITNLALEADGITNGMATVLAQMGLLPDEFSLAEFPIKGNREHFVKTGQYIGKSKYKSHGEYKAANGKDIYQTPQDSLELALSAEGVNDAISKVIEGKWRNFLKSPVMLFIYGAGVDNIVEAAAASLIWGNGYISGALSNGTLNELIKNLKIDKPMKTELKVFDINTGMLRNPTKNESSMGEGTEVYTQESLDLVQEALIKVLDKPMKKAFAEEFGSIMKFRQVLKTVEEMNYLVFKIEVDKRVKSLGKDKLTDLTTEQISDIYTELQNEGTYYGAVNATGGLQDYVKLGTVDGESGIMSVTVAGTKFAGTVDQQTLNQLVKDLISNVGAVGVTAVHNIDGSVMIEGNTEAVLNIYDALMMGVNPISNKKSIYDMNKAFYEINMRHSILGKAVQKFIKNIDKYNDIIDTLLTEGTTNKDMVIEFSNVIERIFGNDIKSADGIENMLKIVHTAREALGAEDINTLQYYISEMLPGFNTKEDGYIKPEVEGVYKKDKVSEQDEVMKRSIQKFIKLGKLGIMYKDDAKKKEAIMNQLKDYVYGNLPKEIGSIVKKRIDKLFEKHNMEMC